MNKAKKYFVLTLVFNALFLLSRIFIAGTVFSIKIIIPNPFAFGLDSPQTVDLFLFNAQKVGGSALVPLAPIMLLFLIFLLFISGLLVYFRKKIKTRLVLAGIILNLFTLMMITVTIYKVFNQPPCNNPNYPNGICIIPDPL